MPNSCHWHSLDTIANGAYYTHMLTARSSKILEAAIQGFIDEGFPISSGWLYESRDFGIKPAMIRAELEELSRQGFLEQPHHSAGRVPSDLGYEFFAKRILEKEGPFGGPDSYPHFFERSAMSDFLEGMSSMLGTLSAAMLHDGVYKTGLEEFLEKWNEPVLMREVVHDFMNLENRLEKATRILKTDEPAIFIGNESPLTERDELAVIACSYEDGSRRAVVAAIGPKRMDYKKAIRIFKKLDMRHENKKS